MSEIAANAAIATHASDRAGGLAGYGDIIGRRRILQLCLAGIWLFDAVLQYQSFMFTKGFSRLLAAAANGNPAMIADPILWTARFAGQHAVAANAAFATVQLVLALGIAWRPSVKFALGASIAWSLAVWWLGEGLGGVLTGAASPLSGAPGPVIIYALLAVLLWPSDRPAATSAADRLAAARFVAERPVGAPAARLLWLAMWGSLACFAVQNATGTPRSRREMVTGIASAERGWLGQADRAAAALLAHHGLPALIVLGAAFGVVAIGVFLPARAARVTLVLAVAVAALMWVVGQDFGAIFTGRGTDPGSAPLLVLLAAAYWPASTAAPAGRALRKPEW